VADEQYLASLKCGKEMMDKYFYKLINETPYYYAAVVLHPALQLAWIQDRWRKYPTWVDTVKKGMKKFAKEYIESIANEAEAREATPSSPERVHKIPDALQRRREADRALGLIDSDDEGGVFTAVLNVDRDYSNHNHRKKHPRVESELDTYYRFEATTTITHPLHFWIAQSQDTACAFPSIAKLALDVFSIPAMSAECERVFSETKRVITDDRNQLQEETIEAIQCQKNWLDNGVVQTELKLL